MRRFMEVIDGVATGLIINAGGTYNGKQYGVNSPDSTYIAAGLYPYVENEKPDYNSNTERLELSYTVNGESVQGVYSVVPLSDEEIASIDRQTQRSMVEEGNKISLEDDNRTTVGATAIIKNRGTFNAWMKSVYNEVDADGTELYKPPADERQLLALYGEDQDNYTFTRYQDEWGYRWYLLLHRDSVNALAIAIYDADDNYLYTTGALLEHPDGGWYTECPAGQADQMPSDVYYKWLLGSTDISGLQVYKGSEESTSGFVRSDSRYD